jgi:bacteriocin-like protein
MSDEQIVNATEEQPKPTGTLDKPTSELSNEDLEHVSGGWTYEFETVYVESIQVKAAPNPSLGDGSGRNP